MKTRKPVSEAPSSHSLIIKVIGVVVGGICISSIFSGNESSITSSMLFLSTTTIFYIQVYYLPYAFTLCMCKLKFASFQVKEAVISTHNTPVERRKRKEQMQKFQQENAKRNRKNTR
ncbi:hypothetical protein [Priestia taiwanensis]|uniref:hypothetical protein n=1 Tax=Priestia taiwanensis TaxID=1347902 RepID=UPI0016678801|nr:hypothetical protein [Priestia taiwanensis]MBM7361587.1 hypothetical protein [Priestia taiwanensis]